MKLYKCLLVLVACLYSLPGVAQITVFPECNFLGNAVSLPVGDYTRADLRRKGVSDNDISSIIVAKGYVVSLYAGDGFRGQSGKLSEVAACLADDNFDNKISSLSVREIANTGFGNNSSSNSSFSNDAAEGVEVFSECHYRGRRAILAAGEYSAAALAAQGMPDNSISSVKIPEGFEISLFVNDFNRGQSGKLSGDNECLVDRFNDVVSSVVVSGEMASTKEPVETGSPVAIVYSECNYRGKAVELKAGEFMAASLEALGMPDNAISSIRLARGAEMHIFKNDFMRGISNSITGNVQCLAGGKFDDNISSIKVIPVDEVAKPVVELGEHVDIFSECEYRGDAASLPAGEYTTADLADLGFPDNTVSSIRVPAGYEATGFEHDFYRGGTIALNDDESCLDTRRADNAISSFKVVGGPTMMRAPAALTARERRDLKNGLDCVAKYVDRNLCTSDAWGVIRDFCSLDKVALMSDGYLEGHVKEGNCIAKNWKELVRRTSDPTIR